MCPVPRFAPRPTASHQVLPMPELAALAPTSAVPLAASVSAPHNRRQRLRLRDLCDEVLASFRAAHARDVISDDDRQDARAVLATLTPRRA